MPIFDEKILKKDLGGGEKFIRLADLLERPFIIQKIEIVEANTPKYGALDQDALYKRGILQTGETLRYVFLDPNDSLEKFYENKGMAFYLGFKQSNIEDETKVQIKRTGNGDSTRYTVTEVKEPNPLLSKKPEEIKSK